MRSRVITVYVGIKLIHAICFSDLSRVSSKQRDSQNYAYQKKKKKKMLFTFVSDSRALLTVDVQADDAN